MQVKTILMDALAIDRALKRISHEIIENNKGVKNVVLLGIARGGVPICEKLSKNISEIEQVDILFDKIDIKHYRDDIAENGNESPPLRQRLQRLCLLYQPIRRIRMVERFWVALYFSRATHCIYCNMVARYGDYGAIHCTLSYCVALFLFC